MNNDNEDDQLVVVSDDDHSDNTSEVYEKLFGPDLVDTCSSEITSTKSSWSPKEDEALYNAHNKHGFKVQKWRAILNDPFFRPLFSGRTSEDLSKRWKVILRHRKVLPYVSHALPSLLDKDNQEKFALAVERFVVSFGDNAGEQLAGVQIPDSINDLLVNLNPNDLHVKAFFEALIILAKVKPGALDHLIFKLYHIKEDLKVLNYRLKQVRGLLGRRFFKGAINKVRSVHESDKAWKLDQSAANNESLITGLGEEIGKTLADFCNQFIKGLLNPVADEIFCLLYDTKGGFRFHSIKDEEAKGIPYVNTFDGRTIRYSDPLIKANDAIKLGSESKKIVDFIKFDIGNVVIVTGGRNRGRVGIVKNREKHKGSFDTLHTQDNTGHEISTRPAKPRDNSRKENNSARGDKEDTNVVMVTGGRNRGRVGIIKNNEKHKGSFDTLHIKDNTRHESSTRLAKPRDMSRKEYTSLRGRKEDAKVLKDSSNLRDAEHMVCGTCGTNHLTNECPYNDIDIPVYYKDKPLTAGRCTPR